ncbi:unnamed protein product, partial [Meganyctiphanes norvegica]
MASNEEELCTSYPDFAVICSFIENFGEKLGLNLPNIEEFQKILEDTVNVSDQLIQTVLQLLRRLNKSVQLDKWERGLQRYAHTYSVQDGWELERFGFKQSKLEVKIRVVKNLLESQFDSSKKFKDKVNLMTANELRLQPNGRDKHGVSYWCQLDEQANLRIYSDDQDEESWSLIARNREELVALIQKLESESPPCASREMSVDGSISGTVTPMGLSNAPTPVESAAPTPVASGRTSPVIDTGQEKDNAKLEEKDQEKNIVEIKQTKENTDTKDKNITGANQDENSLERRVIKSLEEKGMTLKEETIKNEFLENKSPFKDKEDKNDDNKLIEDKDPASNVEIKINEKKVKEEEKDSKKVLQEEKETESSQKELSENTIKSEENSKELIKNPVKGADKDKIRKIEKESMQKEFIENQVKNEKTSKVTIKMADKEAENEKNLKLENEPATKEVRENQVKNEETSKEKNIKADKEEENYKRPKLEKESTPKKVSENEVKNEKTSKESSTNPVKEAEKDVKVAGKDIGKTLQKEFSQNEVSVNQVKIEKNSKELIKNPVKEADKNVKDAEKDKIKKIEKESSQKELIENQVKNEESSKEIVKNPVKEAENNKSKKIEKESTAENNQSKKIEKEFPQKEVIEHRGKNEKTCKDSNKNPVKTCSEILNTKKDENIKTSNESVDKKVDIESSNTGINVENREKDKKCDRINIAQIPTESLAKSAESNLNSNIDAQKTKSLECSTSNIKLVNSPSQNQEETTEFLSKINEDISSLKNTNLVPKTSSIVAKIESKDEPALKKQKTHHEEESVSQNATKDIKKSTVKQIDFQNAEFGKKDIEESSQSTSLGNDKKLEKNNICEVKTKSDNEKSIDVKEKSDISDKDSSNLDKKPILLKSKTFESKPELTVNEDSKIFEIETRFSEADKKSYEEKNKTERERIASLKPLEKSSDSPKQDSVCDISKVTKSTELEKNPKKDSPLVDSENKTTVSNNKSIDSDKNSDCFQLTLKKTSPSNQLISKLADSDKKPVESDKKKCVEPEKVEDVEGALELMFGGITESEENSADTVSGEDVKDSKSKLSKDSDVGEAIEEPVLIVKGDGEGALCNAGNPLFMDINSDIGCSSLRTNKPWWECFDNYDDTPGDLIEEEVMYFWGQGNGADCDAGNNGDETENKSDSKNQSDGNNKAQIKEKKGQIENAFKDNESLRKKSESNDENKEEKADSKVNGVKNEKKEDKKDGSENKGKECDMKCGENEKQSSANVGKSNVDKNEKLDNCLEKNKDFTSDKTENGTVLEKEPLEKENVQKLKASKKTETVNEKKNKSKEENEEKCDIEESQNSVDSKSQGRSSRTRGRAAKKSSNNIEKDEDEEVFTPSRGRRGRLVQKQNVEEEPTPSRPSRRAASVRAAAVKSQNIIEDDEMESKDSAKGRGRPKRTGKASKEEPEKEKVDKTPKNR